LFQKAVQGGQETGMHKIPGRIFKGEGFGGSAGSGNFQAGHIAHGGHVFPGQAVSQLSEEAFPVFQVGELGGVQRGGRTLHQIFLVKPPEMLD
tara:strand:+ start:522 stop:800 length:279 start_codon:yes stop_codon:yes gene_type:complete